MNVYRQVAVPNAGSEDFARTGDTFYNPSTTDPVTTTVRIVGNLGCDGATTVFMTSDGDTLVEPTDLWIGTDEDVDGSGTPAIIHYIHGPAGLAPTSVIRIDDNIEWSYQITVAPGETLRLASFTILANSRAEAIAAANSLVTPTGFGGQAAAFLTPEEVASLANFQFNQAPVANDQSVGATEDASAAITLTGSDPEESPLTYHIVAGPTHGLLTGSGPDLTYTPDPEYNGSDSFTFRVNDGLTDSATATVAISIMAVNDAPVASGSAALASVDEDTASPPGASVGSLFLSNFSDSVDEVSGGSTANTFVGIAISGHPSADAGLTVYRDSDGDGYGSKQDFIAGNGVVLAPGTTAVPYGFSPNGEDWLDNFSLAFGEPAAEILDGLDNDIDGAVDDGFVEVFVNSSPIAAFSGPIVASYGSTVVLDASASVDSENNISVFYSAL